MSAQLDCGASGTNGRIAATLLALAEHLSALEGCELRLTDRTEQPGDPRTRLPDPFWLSQLDDSEATHALLDGVDQIIHAEPFAAGDMPLEDDAWCDIPSRCTYNLLHAAAEVGVSRVICLSSMAVFNSVDGKLMMDNAAASMRLLRNP